MRRNDYRYRYITLNEDVLDAEKEKWDGFIHACTEEVQRDKRNQYAYFNRGVIYLKKGKFLESITDFNEGIKLDPTSARLYFARAVLHHKREEYHLALTDYGKAIEFSENKYFLAAGLLHSAKTYYRLNRYDEAISTCTKVIELSYFTADAYNDRGFVLLTLDRFDEALYDFNRAIETDRFCISAYLNRADVFLKKNELIWALADFIQILKISPEHIFTKKQLALLLKKFVNSDRMFDDIKKLPKKEAIPILTHAMDVTTALGAWVIANQSYKSYMTAFFYGSLQTRMKQYYKEITADHVNVRQAARLLHQAVRQNEKEMTKQILKPEYLVLFSKNTNMFFNCSRDIVKIIASNTADNLSPEVAMKIVENYFCRP